MSMTASFHHVTEFRVGQECRFMRGVLREEFSSTTVTIVDKNGAKTTLHLFVDGRSELNLVDERSGTSEYHDPMADV